MGDRDLEGSANAASLRRARRQHAAAGMEISGRSASARIETIRSAVSGSSGPEISAGTCWNASFGRSAEKKSIGMSTSTGPGRPFVDRRKRALHDPRQIRRAIDAVDALAERPIDLRLVRVLVEVHFRCGCRP